MVYSVCLWGLREPPIKAIEKLAALDISDIDVEPAFTTVCNQSPSMIPMKVNCMAGDHLMPQGGQLGNQVPDASRIAMAHVKDSIQEAALLGAEAVYVGPPSGAGTSLRQFGASVTHLADQAASAGLRFCIEHAPHSTLESATETIAFSKSTGHPNIHVLVDIGHCLLVGENPIDVIYGAAAEERLGYVHFDDNNGKDDLHLPLTEGKFSADDIRNILMTIRDSPYDGALGVEVKDNLDDPLMAVMQSLQVLVDAEANTQW